MKRIKSILLVTLSLIFGFVVLAPESFATTGTRNIYQPNAAITKIVRTPVGTTLPDPLDFEFDITPINWDNTAFDGSNMPQFDSITLSYSTDMTTPSANAVSEGITNPYTDDDALCYVLESENIFLGMTGDWQGAGKYEYSIKEIPDTFILNNYSPAENFTESMTWSGAEYRLFIYVLEDTNGDLYIDGIGVIKIKNDAGEDQPEEKISVVTPGGDDKEYFWSQIQFKNDYWKTSDGDPENPDTSSTSLSVSKTVTGSAIVAADYDRFFGFNMTLTVPSIVPDNEVPTYYAAFVVDANGDVVNDLTGYADASVVGSNGNEEYIKFVPGQETSFNLKHGEKLIFVDTIIGSSYEISESATPYFIPSYIITTAGTSAAEVTGNTSQSISTDVEHTGEGQGTDKNHAAFKNTCNATPETGLTRLQIYGLGIIGLIALIVFIVISINRKRRDSE